MNALLMPSLGADMQSGTLVKWHVQVGDAVYRGDIVGEVETDKGVFDIDSVEEGIVEELLVAEGQRVPVQTPLARLRTPTEVSAPPLPSAESASVSPAPPVALVGAAPVPASPPDTTTAPRRRVSPLARRIAAELHVNVDTVQGTGEHGAVTSDDVKRAARATTPAESARRRTAPPKPDSDRALAMRNAIANAMSRSKREIPHYYLSQEMDFSVAATWLETANRSRALPDRMLPVAVLLTAVARALPKYPEFNGTFENGAFHAQTAVHIGVAVRLRTGGLIAPAIRDAQAMPPDALMRALYDLVERARTGQLRTSELSNATVTVTALAEGAVREVYGVIYPPQVAIIGFGAVADRPWATENMLGARRTVVATISADHRVNDGFRAAALLNEIQRLLLSPELL